jgi:outer membrane protein assembly factor BamA
LAVENGDTLTEENLERAEAAASVIPYVGFLPPVKVLPNAGYTSADLEYRFMEKRRFSVNGGGGYIPDGDAGLVWNGRATLRNLAGAGREVQVSSERRETGRQALQVDYGQPLFLFGVGYVKLGVATRDYRDEFYEFDLKGRYDASLSVNTAVGLGLGWKRVEPSTSLSGFSRLTVGLSLRRESPDRRPNPVSGYVLGWSLDFAHREYSGGGSSQTHERRAYNETRISVTLERYMRLVGPLCGCLKVNYAGLETAEELPPLSELALLGGPGSIRGYRNEQFTAQRAAYGSIEPRVRFNQGYFFVFYDAAYINRPVSVQDVVVTEELFRYGFGVGLNLHDRDRSLTLSLGWSEDVAFDEPRLSIELSYDL